MRVPGKAMRIALAERGPAAIALTACILGLATCPWLFIAAGALSQFAPAFSFIMLPPFHIGSGFLLWRYLARPRTAGGGVLLPIAEILSWGAIAVFLFFVSAMSLQRTAERIGSSSTSFLLASLVWLPLVLWHETALEVRIKRLPRGVCESALVILVVVAGIATVRFFLAPSNFILG
jgi:hypothetical protein